MARQCGDEIVLDATTLEPPEPLRRATEILQQLSRGQYLRMVHRRLPYPLFDICSQLGIDYRHFSGEQDSWVMLFWRRDDPATAERCRQLDQ